MKLTKTLLASTALTVAAGVAHADGHMASEMTIVSWGGAYSNSQQKAYHDPYMEKTGVNIINDESSAEAVAKLRAMNEAGNVTWDVVDVVAADAIRLCDEGLAMEIDPDEHLAAAPDGTSAEDDFGDLLVSDCFIPQIVYSTTFGYRTDMVGDTPPTSVCAVFDTETAKLLFRAPGTDSDRSNATLMDVGKDMRKLRSASFFAAADDMIVNLDEELSSFKRDVESGERAQVEWRGGGGSLGVGLIVLLSLLAVRAATSRRQRLVTTA